jgi:hypothetical protein
LVRHKELLLLIEKKIALLKSSINTARIRQLSVTEKKAVTKRSTDATLFQLQLVPDWKISSD